MKVSDEIRRERKAAVLRAMQKLRAAFPLQQAMEGADPALRAAYVRALSHWTLQGYLLREISLPTRQPRSWSRWMRWSSTSAG